MFIYMEKINRRKAEVSKQCNILPLSKVFPSLGFGFNFFFSVRFGLQKSLVLFTRFSSLFEIYLFQDLLPYPLPG